ncbi:trypsin Inhibitor like cysteine rich domain protein [Ancylostoma caninum]|uniref:Trypsin Inhibitor like cysteine rich domain protein n=1 Tax=Ancylostoma caninum TaxID=29170 RepID=A0A368F728_ANCCA|nr:trypsin Inhibitor like cysteine rich domain protein [Ancylostoma caninum]
MVTLYFIPILFFTISQCSGNPTPKCGENERFYICGNACERTCEEQEKTWCPRACYVPGDCVCLKGFYRNKNGKCVTSEECEEDFMEFITFPTA